MGKALKIISISDLRQNAGCVVRGFSSSREFVFVTRRGQAAAVESACTFMKTPGVSLISYGYSLGAKKK